MKKKFFKKTKCPVVVAMIGLIGSGKSSVAREIAQLLKARLIEADAIRIELRKNKLRYEGVRNIVEEIASHALAKGNNIVIDADFIDVKKQKELERKVHKIHGRVLYVRTYADLDTMIGRIISAKYPPSTFFGGASVRWHGNTNQKGMIAKLRGVLRRAPHHYEWENKNGGQWTLKKSKTLLFADIDTSDPKHWKKKVRILIQKLKHL